jgi:hypothetical protein
VDNHVNAIRLNGKPLAVPEHGYESSFEQFISFQAAEGFVEGTNVLDFDVFNGRQITTPGEVSGMGLCVELQGSVIQGGIPPAAALEPQPAAKTPNSKPITKGATTGARQGAE